jgi:hypothetical protein
VLPPPPLVFTRTPQALGFYTPEPNESKAAQNVKQPNKLRLLQYVQLVLDWQLQLVEPTNYVKLSAKQLMQHGLQLNRIVVLLRLLPRLQHTQFGGQNG